MSTTHAKFNDKLHKLEEIYNTIKNIESNDLDTLIELYQQGLILSKDLQSDLNKFEQKITTIQNYEAPQDFKSQNTTSSQENNPTIENTEQSSSSHTPKTNDDAEYVADLFSDINE